MFIHGIGISGYRSFGDDIQFLYPFSKVNIFVGRNNSGKSNILLLLSQHYKNIIDAFYGKAALKFQSIDRPIGISSGKIKIALSLYSEPYKALINKCESEKGSVEFLRKVLSSKVFTLGTDNIWLYSETQWDGKKNLTLPDGIVNDMRAENILDDRGWSILWNSLLAKTGGNILRVWIPETLHWIRTNVEFANPTINLIPAIRRIQTGSFEPNDFSGIGIIERLAKLQNPDYDKLDLKDKFEEINNFLRNVTGDHSATLEIPYDRDKILVHMNGRSLPLSSLGTGIHEVITLASAATILERQVICIEEPELHLHPSLQKKLLQYIVERTDNQYFITTHSAHLLDTPDVAIFHVSLQDGVSKVIPVDNDSQKFAICADLGYRASDLLQTNCVIWVEGPSDRIYLSHWIHTVDPTLIEGLHYSIMFYGGRLLSHLSADDPEISEFISLRRLNRNICILIDSDRHNPRSRLNETKKRVRSELDKGSGFSWVTKGREVENYIAPELLEAAVCKVHPNAVGLVNTDTYSNCLKQYRTRLGVSKESADKVKVAREVVKSPANLDILDLKPMISKLIDFIQKSNEDK